jgi:hypothetical protein
LYWLFGERYAVTADESADELVGSRLATIGVRPYPPTPAVG